MEQLIAKHKHVDYYYSEFTKSNRLLFEIAAMFDRAEVLKSLLEFATVRAEMVILRYIYSIPKSSLIYFIFTRSGIIDVTSETYCILPLD